MAVITGTSVPTSRIAAATIGAATASGATVTGVPAHYDSIRAYNDLMSYDTTDLVPVNAAMEAA